MTTVDEWDDLWNSYNDPTKFCKLLKKKVLGRDNLVIRLARQLRGNPGDFRKRIKEHQAKLVSQGEDQPGVSQAAWDGFWSLLDCAIFPGPNATSADIVESLHNSIAWYTARWGSNTRCLKPPAFDESKWATQVPKPVWYHALPTEWQAAFLLLAAERPDHWLDPALNLVGGIVAWVHGTNGGKPWCHRNPNVTTWIMFVGASGAHVGRLSLWRVDKGRGLFYPHPLAGSWLATDKQFQIALQNAWYRVIQPTLGWYHSERISKGVTFDICWSVDFEHDTSIQTNPALVGRSGEAAISCALLALKNNDLLDPRTVVGCMYKNEDPNLDDPESDRQLLKVDNLLNKLDAKFFGDKNQQAWFWDLVIHADQDHSGVSSDAKLQEDHRGLEPHRVSTLGEAYRWASRWERLTRDVNKSLAKAARSRIVKYCHGQNAKPIPGYVPSHLKLPEHDQPGKAQSPKPQPVPDAGKVYRGRVSGVTWLIADSGIGKSTLCDYTVVRTANDNRYFGRVPVLINDLNARITKSAKSFHDYLVTKFMHVLGKTDTATGKLVIAWLERMRRSRRLVFIIDALDQCSATAQSQLRIFLNHPSLPFGGCPIYVTGRESTQQLIGTDELVLNVKPFDDPQLDAFFGGTMAQTLKTLFPDVADGDSPIRVPMVAGLLIESVSPSNELKSLNRERVYYLSIDDENNPHALIRKGIDSAKTRGAKVTLDVEQVVDLLGIAAWTMMKSLKNYSGTAESKHYDTVVDKMWQVAKRNVWHVGSREDLVETLIQINVFTRLIDHSKRRLDWRHLSLCEYLAGIHLAECLTENEQVDAIGEILDMLTAVGAARKEYDEKTSQGESIQHPVGISPRDRWLWPLRFALCRAFANQTKKKKVVNQHALKTLACAIMSCGDPYVVYRAITEDHVQLPDELDGLARWLVHQTWTLERDYTPNDAEDWPDLPAASATVLDAVTTLFDPKYRNGPVLPPAWRIVEQLGTESDAAQAVREKLLPQDSSNVLELLDSFKPCPPPDFPQEKYGDHFRKGVKANEWIFKMGAGEDDKEAFFDERPQIEVAIRAFDMAEIPVTNAELEWLDPSHYWLRNQYSRSDDQPALYVNYWTATFYAWWVDQIVRRSETDAPAVNLVIRLPTECEYEFAARGGSPDVYPWGATFDEEKCPRMYATLARDASLEKYRNGFKLLQTVGHPQVWCADAYVGDILKKKKKQPSQPVKAWFTRPQPASSVSARGGGLSFYPRFFRVSYRNGRRPAYLYVSTGFRLCRGEAFPESS